VKCVSRNDHRDGMKCKGARRTGPLRASKNDYFFFLAAFFAAFLGAAFLVAFFAAFFAFLAMVKWVCCQTYVNAVPVTQYRIRMFPPSTVDIVDRINGRSRSLST